jgi:hypothetical protein
VTEASVDQAAAMPLHSSYRTLHVVGCTRMLHVACCLTKVSAEEAAATRQTVSEDRKHAVEAARARSH